MQVVMMSSLLIGVGRLDFRLGFNLRPVQRFVHWQLA